MSRALWIAKKKQLCYLIKQVSDAFGGDEVEWLREYALEVIEANKDDLGKAISCFESLTKGMEKKSVRERERAFKKSACGQCGYVPPFCRADLEGKCTNVSRRTSQ